MTCIVGLEHDKGVTLGVDSAASDGETLTRRADEKLFTVGPYMFAFCGSFRMGQLLRYSLTPPELPAQDMDRHMATTFVDAVRDCLAAGGYAQFKNNVERGGTFLVAVAGTLYEVEDDYQVARQAKPYMAEGCGIHFALGSLHTTEDYDFTPDQRVRMALAAAAEFSPFVSAPFRIKTAL